MCRTPPRLTADGAIFERMELAMPELIYLNGKVLPLADATIGVEDRGFQFADGVYEVIRIYDGQAFTLTEHLDRLERSAAGIEIKPPLSADELASAIRGVIDQSGTLHGMVYVQLTRGCCARNHVWDDQTPPTLLFYTRELPQSVPVEDALGVKLITRQDDRWAHCWIKSIALLPNVLAKNVAHRAGADEAVFVHNGMVTECCSTNIFAVVGNKLITHPVGSKVLPGITRAVLFQLAGSAEVEMIERPLAEQEAAGADELFITSTTREINWVSHWNDRQVASGPGPVTRRLHKALRARIARDTRPAA